MKITWLGHSAVKIEASKTIYIDPFLTGNPGRQHGARRKPPRRIWSSSRMIMVTI